MNGQYLCNRAITVSYAYKKDTKGERHGTMAGVCPIPLNVVHLECDVSNCLGMGEVKRAELVVLMVCGDIGSKENILIG